MNTKNSNFTNQETSTRRIKLDLLALDLDSCTRCVGTLDNIATAIEKVESILEVTETQVEVNKILIESEEEAKAHRFVSSPTIRINDRDIIFETLESACGSCTDLCGGEEDISCRVWKYQGQAYTDAPEGLIVDSLMADIYGGHQQAAEETETYHVPQNLKRFFAGKAEKEGTKTSACCSTEKQEACCEPSEKAACCGTRETETCGCQ
ncbi:MAG: DUF2703 domain-containing protein [Balneolaceae bacterium]|nr:DUF2703 domain-containing protein [Balneolaceae bacterium]